MTSSANDVKLTKSTLNILRHLWDADNMTAHFNDIWKASGATYRGFCRVLDRAEESRFVAESSVRASFALTFGGMMALREHYTALYNARPCEAYRLDRNVSAANLVLQGGVRRTEEAITFPVANGS